MLHYNSTEREATSALPRIFRRDLLRELVARDMKLRYRRSILGIVWSLLNPMLQLIMLSVVFSFILPLDIENYTLFLFIGLISWIWLSSSLTSATPSIVEGRALIRRPRFPAGILPVVAITSNLIHFLLSLPVVLLIIVISGTGIYTTILLLPIVIGLQYIFTLSICIYLAVFQVTFRDTQHLVGVFLFFWFYLTPIFYNTAMIPEQYQALYALNPMVHIIGAYRAILMLGTTPPVTPLLVIGMISLLLTYIGLQLLQRTSYRFAEEL